MNKQQPSEIQNHLESIDPLVSEPVPAGWSRRNWVKREAAAFAAAAGGLLQPPREPVTE